MGRYGVRAVDLRNEMKWRVLLELVEADGNVRTHEVVARRRAITGASPETAGLAPAKGKSHSCRNADPFGSS